MRVDVEALRTLLAVMQAGGVTAASDGLGRSVPALSRRLSRLEDQIGSALLDRSSRPAALTPVGRELLRRAQRPLEELEEVLSTLREAGGVGRREITIASIPTAAYHLLPRTVSAFERRFPSLRVRVRDLAAGEVTDAVSRGTADLGITFAEPLSRDLAFQVLLRDPFVLAVPSAHPLARRRSVAWADLAQERLIGIGRASDNRVILDRSLVTAGLRPRWHHEVQHLTTALGFVENGLGLAPVPRMALTTGGRMGIATPDLVRPRVVRTIGVIHHRRDIDPLVRAFLEQVAATAGQVA